MKAQDIFTALNGRTFETYAKLRDELVVRRREHRDVLPASADPDALYDLAMRNGWVQSSGQHITISVPVLPAPVDFLDDAYSIALARFRDAKNMLVAAQTRYTREHEQVVAACKHAVWVPIYNHVEDTLGNTIYDQCTVTYRCVHCAKALHTTKNGRDRTRPAGDELDLTKYNSTERQLVLDSIWKSTPNDDASITDILNKMDGFKNLSRR